MAYKFIVETSADMTTTETFDSLTALKRHLAVDATEDYSARLIDWAENRKDEMYYTCFNGRELELWYRVK